MNYLLNISYDGTNYAGWQRQENAVTVQQKIEEALSKLYKEEIKITGSSRTDAGVHALGQKAVFRTENPCIPLEKIPYALNANLPENISVTKAKIVANDFHPQYSAKNKTYIYRIFNAAFRNPLMNNYSWHVYHKLDISLMNEAAKDFCGEHDFTAFCAAGGSAKTTIRVINSAEVYEEGGFICYEVNGNGFLYNMVRIMAGTLVYIGCGKLQPNDIKDIILSKNRNRGGITAPPQGLCLVEVYF